jgi:hypothetical protein
VLPARLFGNKDTCPANSKVQEQEWKAEQGVGFIENMQEREVHHDDAQDEKDDPGFPQLQSMQDSVENTVQHDASLL